MQYWLWSATKENWEILKIKRVWATYNRSITTQIKKGDVLIFYVKGTMHFKGIFRVISDWYETKELIWSDEIKEEKKKYPYQIDLELIQLGEANYKDLIPRLKFVEKKNAPQVYIYGTGGGPVNFRKPLAESDYEIILNEMKKKPVQPPVFEPTLLTHSELINMIVELGEMFGKSAEREYLAGPYRYDAVWKRVKVGNPTKVFEVHDKGVLDSALAKLKHAYDIWSADLFLVVTRHEDKERAKVLLAGSFHEIGEVTTLMQPEEIKEMYEYKKKFIELEKKLR
ncbi:MAG: EVE domain-containing protein [Candidatus Bathyarchaeota archaeon]|jgi:predicted RNA-binding protein|nr:EVE domain-containing protein [Candidatus Bathyarchaeota archaeon A05DMB-3]MDH7607064.1 EVE domain-containing protein [Candidatus Bathyarchaeota archaeon]